MIKFAFVGAGLLVGGALCLLGAMSVYSPRLLSAALDPRGWHRRLHPGPHTTGRPIEDIAVDLRRLLAEHDQILATRSQWYVVHDLRVCERSLHDAAEEAARAVGLPGCPATVGGWTTLHLGVRLRQLGDAGFTLPHYAGLGT